MKRRTTFTLEDLNEVAKINYIDAHNMTLKLDEYVKIYSAFSLLNRLYPDIEIIIK